MFLMTDKLYRKHTIGNLYGECSVQLTQILYSALHARAQVSQSQTNSSEQSASWEANRSSTNQEISPYYGARKFITTLTIARHLSLP